MWRRVSGVTRIAHGPDDITSIDQGSRGNQLFIQVSVVVELAATRPRHPHHISPETVLTDRGDNPVGGGNHGRAATRKDVDPIVRAAPTVACIAEEALDIVGSGALHRDAQRWLRMQ